MTDLIRLSPSGPVISENLELSSDSVINESAVPDAATLTGALNRLAASYRAFFNEDFVSGINTFATATGFATGFGQKNWTVNAVTSGMNRTTTTGGGLVIGAFTTTNTAGSLAVALGGNTLGLAGNGMRIDRYDYVYWRVFPNSAVSIFGATRCGLGNAPVVGVTPLGSQALYFEKLHNPANSPWNIVLQRGGVVGGLSGFNTAAGYAELEMFRGATTGNFSFAINGTPVTGSIAASQLPTGTLAPLLIGAAAPIAFDRFGMIYTRR